MLALSAAAKSLQSCLTLRSHKQQPTRLRCPWDSPGKNTGVGCHFLLQCMKVKSESEVSQSRPTLSDPMDCSLRRGNIAKWKRRHTAVLVSASRNLIVAALRYFNQGSSWEKPLHIVLEIQISSSKYDLNLIHLFSSTSLLRDFLAISHHHCWYQLSWSESPPCMFQ